MSQTGLVILPGFLCRKGGNRMREVKCITIQVRINKTQLGVVEALAARQGVKRSAALRHIIEGYHKYLVLPGTDERQAEPQRERAR